jgi:uncharacterized membrane protein YgaE (UPF0421/DUF939 family)
VHFGASSQNRPKGANLGAQSRRLRPSASEVALVLKVGLAAGVAYSVAHVITGVPNPVLAPAAAVVTVHATAWSSVREAIQRSVAVAVGVVVALAVGEFVGLNGLSVGVLVAVSLGVSLFALRLSGGAANQLPITVLLVLAVVGSGQNTYGLGRAVDTIIGAAIGALTSVVLPASRLDDARRALVRVTDHTAGTLGEIGAALRGAWSGAQSTRWRADARVTRDSLVRRAVEAVGTGGHAARWNHRDRRHLGDLARYEAMAPRLERITVSVSEIARDLDRIAPEPSATHAPMPRMGDLLAALGRAVHAYGEQLDRVSSDQLRVAIADVGARRDDCEHGALRRARIAADGTEHAMTDPGGGEWLEYGDILLQVDRIVIDLTPPDSVE